MVYQQLTCDGPVKNCGHIISAFSRILLKKELSSGPSTATYAQMAYELGVVTKIQLMGHMLSNNAMCLSTTCCCFDDLMFSEKVHQSQFHLYF